MSRRQTLNNLYRKLDDIQSKIRSLTGDEHDIRNKIADAQYLIPILTELDIHFNEINISEIIAEYAFGNVKWCPICKDYHRTSYCMAKYSHERGETYNCVGDVEIIDVSEIAGNVVIKLYSGIDQSFFEELLLDFDSSNLYTQDGNIIIGDRYYGLDKYLLNKEVKFRFNKKMKLWFKFGLNGTKPKCLWFKGLGLIARTE